MRMLAYVFLVVSHLCPQLAWANNEAETKAFVAKVEALFDSNTDWADIKFRADGIANPEMDSAVARQELDRLKRNLSNLVEERRARGAHEKLAVLKQFVYQAGDWNDHRPFAYDLVDPLGKKLANRYLAHYLATRKGNCVTMPILLAILGKHIGLNMTLASAPRHLFAKLIDDGGREWNLEATSGAGYTRNSHFRRQMPMTDAAIANGLYLKSFTEDEVISEIASVIIVQLNTEQKYESVIAVNDVLLKHHPKSVVAIITRGSAFTSIMRRDFLGRYKYASEMTPQQRQLFEALAYHNQLAFQTAESLGWTENDGEKDRWPAWQGAENAEGN